VTFTLLAGGDPFEGYREEDLSTGKLCWRGGWSEWERREVARSLPGALRHVEERLQRRLARPFRTVLAEGGGELRDLVLRLGGNPDLGVQVLGVALPALDVLILRGGLLPGSMSYQVTLHHEITHLVLHAHPGVRIPRWLDEGVAQWVSGIQLAPSEDAHLALLARLGSLYSFESLEYAFPPLEDLTSIAYQQSLLMVEYARQRWGADAVPRLLSLVEAGQTGCDALAALSGLPLAALERDFTRWVAARKSLVAVLSYLFNFWTLTSLLALVAIVCQVVRRRRKLKAMELASDESPAPEQDLQEPS
jgi:hypothetical protein